MNKTQKDYSESELIISPCNSRIVSYCSLILFLAITTSCSSKHSGATEQSILSNFSDFYLQAAEENQLEIQSLQKINRLQENNTDAYRTIAYTWNNQALKECATQTSKQDDEVELSDFDKFVQKEKSNFHVQEIDDAIKPCIKNFYIENWKQINKMISFNINNIYQ